MRSEETHKFKDSILGRIPKEWEVKELGYCAAIIDPQPDHRTPPAVKEGIPYLGISDFLDNGDINTQSVRLVSPDVYIKQKNSFEISAGDILFGKIGTIGMPKLLPINIKYALSANSILIKPYKNPSFIYWALLSPATENQIQTEIHSTTQPAFGIQKLRKLKIPFPQKQEQFVIETIFNTFQKATSLEVSLLNKYKSIKTGLMQNLLTGKVSVEPLLDSKN
jgi:type I restriction enzyme S subunit